MPKGVRARLPLRRFVPIPSAPRGSEVLDVIGATAGGARKPDADHREAAVEDVGPVLRACHPGTTGVGGGPVPDSQVLADPSERAPSTEVHDPVQRGLTEHVAVREEPVAEHVPRVVAGRVTEHAIAVKRGQPASAPLTIRAVHDRRLDARDPRGRLRTRKAGRLHRRSGERDERKQEQEREMRSLF